MYLTCLLKCLREKKGALFFFFLFALVVQARLIRLDGVVVVVVANFLGVVGECS